MSSGLYYKNIMIVNDASTVVSDWCHNLEHHLRLSITLLQLSIMLLELSIMLLESSITLLEFSIILLENIYSIGITHDDHHITVIICL